MCLVISLLISPKGILGQNWEVPGFLPEALCSEVTSFLPLLFSSLDRASGALVCVPMTQG